MTFARPSQSRTDNSTFFIVSEHVGTLILFKVLGQKADHQTAKFGVKSTVWADVMLVDGPKAGTIFPRAEIFHTKLYEGLFDHVGETVLARLNKGERAFFLNDPTPEDEKQAERMVTNGRSEVAAPVTDPWDPKSQQAAATHEGNPFAADEPAF